tara:strand:- start:12741 stop:13697 length:957 start_codon:yes stop_codon:yes gene_type:complete
MTDQINLHLVWANTGGTAPVGDAKYVGGWVAEIPTYQNFNYMVQGLDKNILHLAEVGYFTWQSQITYVAGVQVISPLGDKFTARAASTGTDPDTDSTNSTWVHGWLVGSDIASLLESDGFQVALPVRTNALYTGMDQVIKNLNPMLEFRTTTASKNWALGNVSGELVAVDLAQAGPDNKSIAIAGADTHRLFHEGHSPEVAEVDGAVPEAPTDGKLYARVGVSAVSGSWVQVTSTTVSIAPPPPVLGAGQGWYNLEDGQFYLDINDGDSSQWVAGNPPTIPNFVAADTSYNPANSTLTSTDVKAALDEIAGRLDAAGA